jgi:hypothetical protein
MMAKKKGFHTKHPRSKGVTHILSQQYLENYKPGNLAGQRILNVLSAFLFIFLPAALVLLFLITYLVS